MGQSDILRVLSQNPKEKFTSKQVHYWVDCGHNNVMHCLFILRKQNEVNYEQIKRQKGTGGAKMYQYWHKK